MVPCRHDSLTPQVDNIDPPSSCHQFQQDTKGVTYKVKNESGTEIGNSLGIRFRRPTSAQLSRAVKLMKSA